jgi:hypothetical protein
LLSQFLLIEYWFVSLALAANMAGIAVGSVLPAFVDELAHFPVALETDKLMQSLADNNHTVLAIEMRFEAAGYLVPAVLHLIIETSP